MCVCKTSSYKDISIKSIERIIKESAFDCGLNYDANYNPKNKDYSIECDYLPCKFTCDGLNNYEYNEDNSTYNLYYIDSKIKKIESEIRKIFRTRFSITLSEIINILKDFSYFEIIYY